MSANDMKTFYRRMLQKFYEAIRVQFRTTRALEALADAVHYVKDAKHDFSKKDLAEATNSSLALAERLWAALLSFEVLEYTRNVGRIPLARRTTVYTNYKLGALADAIRYHLAEKGYTKDNPLMEKLYKLSQLDTLPD